MRERSWRLKVFRVRYINIHSFEARKKKSKIYEFEESSDILKYCGSISTRIEIANHSEDGGINIIRNIKNGVEK